MPTTTRTAARLFVLVGVAVGATTPCRLAEDPSLDLHRWSVRGEPAMEDGLRRKLFGSYRFEVADARETFRLSFGMVEGVPWPQFLDQGNYAEARKRVLLRPGDVVVASYPKSGTTWTEQIVLLLLHGSHVAPRLRPETRNHYSAASGLGKTWLEPTLAAASSSARSSSSSSLRRRRGGEEKNAAAAASGSSSSSPVRGGGGFRGGSRSLPAALASFEAIPSPRLVKSHAPFRMLLGVGGPPSSSNNNNVSSPSFVAKALDASGAKVIYVARNAKDAAVSLFFQRAPVSGGKKRQGRRMPMDAWAALYLSGHMSCGPWFDHVADWYAASRVSPNVLFATYEDLTRDALATVTRIANHLGLRRDRLELERVVNSSSFDAMSRGEKTQAERTLVGGERNKPGRQRRALPLMDGARANHAARYQIPPGTRFDDVNVTSSSHMRQGQLGSWRTYFSPTLDRQFNAVYDAKLRAAADRAAADFGIDLADPPAFDFGDDAAPNCRRRR